MTKDKEFEAWLAGVPGDSDVLYGARAARDWMEENRVAPAWANRDKHRNESNQNAEELAAALERIAVLEAALREARVHLMETFPAGKAEAISIIDRALEGKE